MPGQGIDQAIQGLVRDRFPLVTPPGEDDGLVPGDQPVEERPDQRRLAGPRPAEDEDRLGPTAAEAGEDRVEDLEVSRPPDQGELAIRVGDVGRVHDLAAQDAR